MHLDELRTMLLEERDSGTLTTIPQDLYARTATDIRTLQQEVFVHEDPFSDEARLLIEKVASIRATIEEIFRIRTEKVVGLAQSQAEGSFIDREDLRVLIPSELEMFNRIVDAIRQSRSQLIEWRAGPGPRKPAVETAYEIAHLGEETVSEPGDERAIEDFSLESEQKTVTDAPFVYDLVQALSSMEPFMGVDGRTYELIAGDILTLPSRNAQVLAERDIVLNIHPG